MPHHLLLPSSSSSSLYPVVFCIVLLLYGSKMKVGPFVGSSLKEENLLIRQSQVYKISNMPTTIHFPVHQPPCLSSALHKKKKESERAAEGEENSRTAEQPARGNLRFSFPFCWLMRRMHRNLWSGKQAQFCSAFKSGHPHAPRPSSTARPRRPKDTVRAAHLIDWWQLTALSSAEWSQFD